MELINEKNNKDAISAFLKHNGIDPHNATGYNNKFETAYFVGDSRKFFEETPIGFSILDTSYSNVSLHDINDIEFETVFKVTEQSFSFDEEYETLTITANESKKHNKEYKVVISSIYLDI